MNLRWWPSIVSLECGFLIFSLSGATVQASAVTYRPGVTYGSWIEYWQSDVDRLAVFRLTVYSVAETTISYTIETNVSGYPPHYSKRFDAIDVRTGTATAGFWFISANLTPGDAIYEGNGIQIKDTVKRRYLGALRWVNHAQRALDSRIGDLYWDKQTGIMLEDDHLTVIEGTTIPFPSNAGLFPLTPSVVAASLVSLVVAMCVKRPPRKRVGYGMCG